MSTNSMEDSLAWLEQETKINTTLSMAQESKAKLNVLSLAVSTIADLTATVKDLKNEVETLKNEVKQLKSEASQNKTKNLTDEEKEQLRELAVEIIKETSPFRENNIDFLDAIVNIILDKSKTIEQGIRVANKLKKCTQLGFHINIGYNFTQYGGIHLGYSKDYKIVYYALYEIRRRIGINKGGMKEILKSLYEGGLDISVQYAIGTPVGSQI